MALATLDLSLFTAGNDSEKEAFATELSKGLGADGFVKIVNHGISDWTVRNIFEQASAFFQLSLNNKVEVANEPGPNPQRGWSSVGAENTTTLYRNGLLDSQVEGDRRDAREHFDFGPQTDLMFPNKWPNDIILPGFRAQLEDAFHMFESCSLALMEALELACRLPRGSFVDKMTRENSASEMRLNHYPEISVEEVRRGKVSRIWPHFDLGVITLLFQDEVGGLEYEDRRQRGSFNRVDCSNTSEMVVNVSETLQRWTNNRLPAGLHRVNMPPELERKQSGMLPERFSIAYFCKADREASVGALDSFVPEDSEPAYKDMTALQYHQQRLQSAY